MLKGAMQVAQKTLVGGKGNPTVPDCCQLIELTDQTVLTNLRRRFEADEIYTFTGCVAHADALRAGATLSGAAVRARRGTFDEPHAYTHASRIAHLHFSRLKDVTTPWAPPPAPPSGSPQSARRCRCRTR